MRSALIVSGARSRLHGRRLPGRGWAERPLPAEAGPPRRAREGAAGGPAHADPSSRRARKAKAREGRSPLFLWLKEVATVVLVAIVLSFLIKTFLFRAFYIPSESMVNTLDVNDRIFVNLLVPEPVALQRGDVVVFRDSQGWLAPAAEKAKGPFTWVQDGADVRRPAAGQLGTAPGQARHRAPGRPRGLLRRRRTAHRQRRAAGRELHQPRRNSPGPRLRRRRARGQGLGHGRQPQPLRGFARPYGHQRRLRQRCRHRRQGRRHRLAAEPDHRPWTTTRTSSATCPPRPESKPPPSCPQPPPSTTNAASAAPAPGSSRASTRSAAAPSPGPSAWESPSWTCSSRSSSPMSGTASCSRSADRERLVPLVRELERGLRRRACLRERDRRTRASSPPSGWPVPAPGSPCWPPASRPDIVLLDGSHNWLSPGPQPSLFDDAPAGARLRRAGAHPGQGGHAVPERRRGEHHGQGGARRR